MAHSKILIVEDDQNLMATLEYNLLKEGYSVVTASDGAQAVEIARSEKPDLIVLDVMLPKLSGFEVCRILRKDMSVPIMMLTAKTEEIDKIVGLEIGADDYMTKPFSMRELLARLRAMLRRADMVGSQPADRADIIFELESFKNQPGQGRKISVFQCARYRGIGRPAPAGVYEYRFQCCGGHGGHRRRYPEN